MKRYKLEHYWDQGREMVEDSDGEWVHHSQAAALLQLAEEKLQRAERECIKVERERDDWKNTHDGLRAVYRDIGNALGADMPAELVNEVARRRMKELGDVRLHLAVYERRLKTAAERRAEDESIIQAQAEEIARLRGAQC